MHPDPTKAADNRGQILCQRGFFQTLSTGQCFFFNSWYEKYEMDCTSFYSLINEENIVHGFRKMLTNLTEVSFCHVNYFFVRGG